MENRLSISEVSEKMRHGRSVSAKTSRPVSFAIGEGVKRSLMSSISAFGFGTSSLSMNPGFNACGLCGSLVDPVVYHIKLGKGTEQGVNIL